MKKLKIQKGDKVVVLSGKDKGKTGIVERVFTKTGSLIIPKINTVKKHTKVTKKNPAGGVVDTERPVPVSKVQLICPACGKRTRIGLEVKGKDKKRVCKKCSKAIEMPKAESKEK
jgi:large subunit ribosomal protein L24